ncbi:MAG TPA: nucleoside-diphosphate kinase [Paenibacillus sp.]|jgi:nucleoside diphosphate kinase
MYPTIDYLLEELSEAERANLKHMAFAIIRPDAIERGFEKEILNDLENSGLFVIGFKYQFVDERQMEEVYRYTQHHMLENQMRPLWWMTREMYRVSPAILLLLAGKYPDEYEDSARYLESIKGSSNPALTQPHHLRYKYQSMNVVLCTIHSSDDHLHSLRESRIFFNREEIARSLQHIPELLNGRIPAPHSFLDQAVNRWHSKAKRTGAFFHILSILQLRILANLLDSDLFGLPLDELNELCQRMYQITLQQLPYVEEAEQIHPILDRELDLLLSASNYHSRKLDMLDSQFRRNCNDRELLIESLKTMVDYRNYEQADFIKFREQLRRNLVVMDDWEALVIETSFVFHMIQLNGYYIK